MNLYTWKITAISTLPCPPAPVNDFAVSANFIVTAVNNENPEITASIQDIYIFKIIENTEYIPYQNLKEQDILDWIQSDETLVINIKANLDGQIESLINPSIVPKITPLPWKATLLKGKK